jgi:hypothetical protein
MSAAVQAALERDHTIDVVNRQRAHDIVWRHMRHPYDLCVYEWSAEPVAAFIAAYLFHMPGLLVVRDEPRHRDAIRASRMVVARDAPTAEWIAEAYPDVPVATLPLGVAPLMATTRPPDGDIRFAVIGSSRLAVVDRAVARARAAGAAAQRTIAGPSGSSLHDADVVIALTWPPGDELTNAVVGMSAGKPVIVMETEATADWPALDPQSWQPRGFDGTVAPIVVSIDPRDEEHSLMLAIRRLSADPSLRASLGAAARAWWGRHATVAHAVAAWTDIFIVAAGRQPSRPSDLPAHLHADGTERAREILEPFGVTVDFIASGRGPGGSDGRR